MHRQTQVMGILNATPDSFFDGGRYSALEERIARGLAICEEGADWIDIGGESTRPGAEPVSCEEEKERVLPLIEALASRCSRPISIDTMKWEVAAAAVERGARMINDVSGFEDPRMREVAVSSGVALCIVHMQGSPRTMQCDPHYEEGIISHLLHWFEARVELLLQEGARVENLYLDPGVGFGKTMAHNFEILHNLTMLRTLGIPLFIGLSRKSFMSKVTFRSSAELLAETIAMNTIACLGGAAILRVHDVRDHCALVGLMDAYSHAGISEACDGCPH